MKQQELNKHKEDINMKNFDINRFGKVMSRLILVRRRSIIKLFAGFLIGFFVIAIMFFPFFHWSAMSDADIRIRLWGNSPFISVVFAMSFFIIATFIISDLGKRQQRINEMMLPATNIEKFLARFILVSVVYPLLITIAFIAADGLQQLTTMLIFYGGRASLVTTWYEYCQSSRTGAPLWVSAEIVLLTNSFTLLGGMFFRKVAWLKTLISLFIIVIGIAISLTIFAYLLYEHTDYELVFDDNALTTIISNLICIGLTVLMYWSSYKLYTRLQVINNRWRNF